MRKHAAFTGSVIPCGARSLVGLPYGRITVRQALEEHGVRLFPQFDIIEIVKNNLFDPLSDSNAKEMSNED
jgi:hypothetical protein